MINPRIESETPVIVQGITGRQGRRHALLMRDYGTNVVGGVAPGSNRGDVDGLPVFQSCAEAIAATRAAASVAIVPPDAAADAVLEAAESGIRLIISVAEGVPAHDSIRVLRRVRDLGTTWIGSSSPGLAVPAARVKLGWIPDDALNPGRIGLISRSGTLSFEIGSRMVTRGLGQSVWIGVGGDFVKGTRFAELLPFFEQDEETDALVVIGEIGGTDEQDLAEAIREHGFAKPVHALLTGVGAPAGITMGHAGAMIHRDHDRLDSKRAALEGAGVTVYTSIGALIDALPDAD